MTASNSELTIRECAFEMIRLCEEHAQDNAALARARTTKSGSFSRALKKSG